MSYTQNLKDSLSCFSSSNVFLLLTHNPWCIAEKEEALAKQEEAKLAKKRAERKAAKEKKKAEQRAALEVQKTQQNGSAGTEKHYSAIPKPAQPSTKKTKVSKSRGVCARLLRILQGVPGS